MSTYFKNHSPLSSPSPGKKSAIHIALRPIEVLCRPRARFEFRKARIWESARRSEFAHAAAKSDNKLALRRTLAWLFMLVH